MHNTLGRKKGILKKEPLKLIENIEETKSKIFRLAPKSEKWF